MAAEARRRHFTEVRRRRRAHEGFSIHCGVRLHENDREGIERLCRYGARGPLTLGRLSRDGDDVYRYRMKRIVRGRDELVMTGKELVRKLAVLVPPPRVHLVRFHGVFAPNAKHRSQVVPKRTGAPAPGQEPAPVKAGTARPTRRDGTSRIDWASLLRRVFKIDVLQCARCGSRMRVISVIEEPTVIEKLLRHLRLPHVPLPTLPARGQKAFAFEAA
jgi:Putative transposase